MVGGRALENIFKNKLNPGEFFISFVLHELNSAGRVLQEERGNFLHLFSFRNQFPRAQTKLLWPFVLLILKLKLQEEEGSKLNDLYLP